MPVIPNLIRDLNTKTEMLNQVQHDTDMRQCPECGMMTIKGMPGGRDAVCHNCGFKDPCCTD